MFNLWGDLRYAARLLHCNPGFTIVAVLSVAAGIGPNTAIFSALDEALLKKLPARDPDRLVTIAYTLPRGGTGDSFSNDVYEQLPRP